ncbi:fibronectin type III domain-containing protein [Streptomyces sp. NPDC001617]
MSKVAAIIGAHKVLTAVIALILSVSTGAAVALMNGIGQSTSVVGAPTNVTMQDVENGRATVHWDPPDSGATVTGYNVTLVPTYNNRRDPQPNLGPNRGVVSRIVDPTNRSSSFDGLLEDCHQRYKIEVNARTARGAGSTATTSDFRPSGIVTPGADPLYVVILVDGIRSHQPGFTMDPYKPTLDSTPSYCPESWNDKQGIEVEADFAGASQGGPWSFFHKWNHGETDKHGNAVDVHNKLYAASEPKKLNGDGSPKTYTHSFMLDAIAAKGAIILPFSYHDNGLIGIASSRRSAALISSGHGDPTFTYPKYTDDDSQPSGKGDIDLYGKLLLDEVRSITTVWPTSKIVIVGHSQGGLVAYNAWKNAPERSQWDVFTLDSPINGAGSCLPGPGPKTCVNFAAYPKFVDRGQYDEGSGGYLGTDAENGNTVHFIGTYGDSPAIEIPFPCVPATHAHVPHHPGYVCVPPLRSYGEPNSPVTLEHQVPFDYIANTSGKIEGACGLERGPSGWAVKKSCPVPAPPDHISECPVAYDKSQKWIVDTGHFVVKYCPGDVLYFNQMLGLQYTPPASGDTVVKTFEPWAAVGQNGGAAPAPGLVVTNGGAATCDSGSADDPGSALAVRCSPPGNGAPCFINDTGGGDPSSPLLCSSDPTSKQVVEVTPADPSGIPIGKLNHADPSRPAWFLILADGRKCSFLGYGTNANILSYDCGGNIGATVPDRSQPTWTVQEGTFQLNPTPSSSRVAVVLRLNRGCPGCGDGS